MHCCFENACVWTNGDAHDDYIRMTESMAMECMYRFYKAVVVVFGPTYLRTPNAEDTAQIMA
jgi:hypothetical protein